MLFSREELTSVGRFSCWLFISATLPKPWMESYVIKIKAAAAAVAKSRRIDLLRLLVMVFHHQNVMIMRRPSCCGTCSWHDCRFTQPPTLTPCLPAMESSGVIGNDAWIALILVCFIILFRISQFVRGSLWCLIWDSNLNICEASRKPPNSDHRSKFKMAFAWARGKVKKRSIL